MEIQKQAVISSNYKEVFGYRNKQRQRPNGKRKSRIYETSCNNCDPKYMRQMYRPV